MRAQARFGLLLLLTAAATCFAAGYGLLNGTTTDGWTLGVSDPSWKPITVQIWKEGPERESSVQTFSDEPCEFSDGEDLKRTFKCDASGKSPLAGTTYVGHLYKGQCEKGDPEYEYVCTEGCGKNPRAPRKLTQGYWEC